MTRGMRATIAISVLLALPMQASADVPSPTRDACRNLTEGAFCRYQEGGPDGNGPVTAGQCVTTTCRSPGPYGQEYACLECRPFSTRADSAQNAVDATTSLDNLADGAAGSSSARLWISLLMGGAALGVGILMTSRNARRRRG